MADGFKRAWDQVELSAQADKRIRAALTETLARDGRVIELHNGEERPMKKKTRRISTTALIAAAMVVILSVTAYAIGAHTDFFETIFGDSGTPSTEAHDVVADPDKPDSGMITVPAYERVPVDQEKAEELVGGQVTDINKTFEMAGVTFTAESVVADENGIGALTFTMSCPDGFPLMEGYEGEMGNMLQIDEDLGWISSSPYFRLSDIDRPINDHVYLDSAASTDTEKHLTAYFYSPVELKAGDVIELVMTEYLYNGQVYTYTDPDTGEERTQKDVDETEEYISFQVGDLVPAVTLTAEDGTTASVSPMGIVLNDWYDGGLDDLTLTYTDGSTYTLRGESVNNTQFGQLVDPNSFGAEGIQHEHDYDGDGKVDSYSVEYPRDDPAYEGMWRSIYVFNRLVEPETVASVHVAGGIDYEGEFQPERTFVP